MGAVAVLAHPFLNLKEPDLRVFLQKAVSFGLDAMETLYVTFDDDLTRRAQQIAAEFGLLQSGGSDFHGSNKPDILIGIGRGNLAVPTVFAHDLQRRASFF
jgi:predicted metal-dependent phosphoesterase TrpH